MCKKLIVVIAFMIPLFTSAQISSYSIGGACVYQRWKQKFDFAPIIGVTVNKTSFSFSSTLTKGKGNQLPASFGSDWEITGLRVYSFQVGHEIGVEDVPVWLVPHVGLAFQSEILQTDRGWLYGQADFVPAFRIEIRSQVTKWGLGYWMSFGNIENGAIGIFWRCNNKTK